MTTIPLTPEESALARRGELRELARPVEEIERRDDAWFFQHPNYDNGMGCDYFHTQIICDSIMDEIAKCCPLGHPGDVVRLEYRFSPIVDESSYQSWRYTITTITVRPNGDGWEWAVGLRRDNEQPSA